MLQRAKSKTDREIEIEKKAAEGGGIETAAKGKKQMVCKCCTHQQFISAGDGCMSFALNRVAGSRA